MMKHILSGCLCRDCADVREMTIKKLLCEAQVHLGCWV